MSEGMTPADLGEPDLQVAGCQLWVHGRQFPDAADYYDGNWLRVTAHCGASGASVWAQGAILMVTDIVSFGDQCAAMLSGGTRSAALDPVEPELRVLLEAADHPGHVHAKVEITPEHLAQAHRFEFEIDQSYLPGIIRHCSAIVQKYPIRGQRDGKPLQPTTFGGGVAVTREMGKRRKPYLLLAVVVALIALSNLPSARSVFVLVGLEPLIHSYRYVSRDGEFEEHEVPEKGLTLGMVEAAFDGYKERTGQPDLALCRSQRPRWWRFWKWYEYWNHPRWQYPYREPVAGTAR